MTVKTDTYCHNCERNFVAEYDVSINGRHRVSCPFCAHDHYRVVQDGEVTDMRWGSANRVNLTVGSSSTYVATASTYALDTSSMTGASTSDIYIRQAWINVSSSTNITTNNIETGSADTQA